ncbi:MAG: hypothetical protein ACOX4Q_05615 [Syntrophomonadales bacterium]|jgi:hypothetical protein
MNTTDSNVLNYVSDRAGAISPGVPSPVRRWFVRLFQEITDYHWLPRLVDLDGIYAAALVTEIEHPGHTGEDTRPFVVFFEQLRPIITKLDEHQLVAFAVQGTGQFGRHEILVLFPFQTGIEQINQIKDQITLYIYDVLDPLNVNA